MDSGAVAAGRLNEVATGVEEGVDVGGLDRTMERLRHRCWAWGTTGEPEAREGEGPPAASFTCFLFLLLFGLLSSLPRFVFLFFFPSLVVCVCVLLLLPPLSGETFLNSKTLLLF